MTPSPRKRATIPAEPQRRSKRVRKEPAPFVQELFADAVVHRPRGFDETTNNAKPKKKKAPRPVSPDDVHLLVSAADRQRLGQMYPNGDDSWLDDMEEYLMEEEQISETNCRRAMTQVTLMSSGDGVTYHHWPHNVWFHKGDAIDLTWNMQELYVQACEYENEYGRDLGNGWLMRHPIKKMHNFQLYLLHEKKKKG